MLNCLARSQIDFIPLIDFFWMGKLKEQRRFLIQSYVTWYFMIFLFILLIFTTGCTYPTKDYFSIPKEDLIIEDLLSKTEKKIVKKYGNKLKFCGIHVINTGDFIERIGLMFNTRQPLSKEELREILVESAHELLYQVNNCISILPYLKNIPFGIEDIQIVIFNNYGDGRSVLHI
ncbi:MULTISPECIES: hypothetical protein [Parachlamydia]|uniref:hypothetical protein n=1 Tax=Parachlamydia TaxID=83551 RepID=UPI001F497A64|nr:hypothetical protein [Parachlamydia acanthamoebae]